MIPNPKPEHEVIPCFVCTLLGGEFIRPIPAALRTAESFRLFGAERVRDVAILPGQQMPLTRLVERAFAWWIAGQNTARSFDHHFTDVGGGRRDQMDWRWQLLACPFPNRFRAGLCLAPSAAGQNKPVHPVAGRRDLVRTRDEPAPIVQNR